MDWLAIAKEHGLSGAAMIAAGYAAWQILKWLGVRLDRLFDMLGNYLQRTADLLSGMKQSLDVLATKSEAVDERKLKKLEEIHGDVQHVKGGVTKLLAHHRLEDEP